MKRFEYKEVKNCEIDKMNELGSMGWELVAIKILGNVNLNLFSYFKREIVEVEPLDEIVKRF